MSDDIKKPAEADALKNMKAEFDRKLSNIEASNRKLLDQVSAMLPKPAPAVQSKKAEDIWFDDPTAAKEMIKSELRQEMANAAVASQRTNNTLAKLVQEFPELNDDQSDLTKKAVEIYEGFSAEDKSSPVAYRAAVREAAQELGVNPRSKRQQDDDSEFVLSGSGAGRTRTDSKASRRDTVDTNTVEFARLMGVDIDDPKVKERIKTNQKRSWKHYGK